MCGRYQFTMGACEETDEIIQAVQRQYGRETWTPGEVRPAAAAPVLISAEGAIRPVLQTWGYRLPGSMVINARAETVLEKPLFRDSMGSQRCAVPTTGFFEWDPDRRKHLFTRPGSGALYLAGLYAIRDGAPYFCILTTRANASMQAIHPRMPVILEREQVSHWLQDEGWAKKFLHQEPPALRHSSEEAQMRLW